MKHQYYLHRQNQPLQADTVIYHVWVGESEREQSYLSKLKSWAMVHGATLMLWEESISYYLLLESERIFTNRGLLDFGFIRADIKVADALALAEVDGWDSYENNLSQPKPFFHQIQFSDPSRLDATAGRIKHHSVHTSPRQYLSQSDGGNQSVISFI